MSVNTTVADVTEMEKKSDMSVPSQKMENASTSKVTSTLQASRTFQISTIVLTLFVVVILLCFFSIVFLIISLYDTDISVIQGIVAPINTDKVCSNLPPGITCFSPNGSTPYQRAYWPSLGDLTSDATQQDKILGAHPLTHQDAWVILFEIPERSKYIYYGFTSYCYDKPNPSNPSEKVICFASTGNTLNVLQLEPTASAKYCGWWVAVNPMAVSIAQTAFEKTWDHVNKPIIYRTSYIPRKMYDPRNRYCIFQRTTLPPSWCETNTFAQVKDYLPQCQAFWFKCKQAGISYVDTLYPVIPRGLEPDERVTVASPSDWANYSYNRVAASFQILRSNIKAFPYLYPMLPKGLNYGFECYDKNIGCRADNRDTCYWNTGIINLEKDQAIVVVLLNHYASGMAKRYCNYTISDANAEATLKAGYTGYMGEVPHFEIPGVSLNEVTSLIYFDFPEAAYNIAPVYQVYCVERSYLSETTVGPDYDAVLPLQTFVVKRATTPIIDSSVSFTSSEQTTEFPVQADPLLPEGVNPHSLQRYWDIPVLM